MSKLARLDPLLWGSLILITSQTFTLYIAFREKHFVETHQIISPEVPLGFPLLYFLGAVVLIGAILFLVPVDKLKIVFKIIFMFLFAWGTFITLALTLPILAASLISITGGLIWLFKPKVWLHNLLMILTLASVGAVFGFLLAP